MSTVIVCVGEKGEMAYPPKPIGTVDAADTASAVSAAKAWCQWQASHDRQTSLPVIDWQRYLSRGTGPSTAHYKGETEDWRFEIWIVGKLG